MHLVLAALTLACLSLAERDAVMAQGQGAVVGCVSDRVGGSLPGVEVVASGPEAKRRAVTDAAGCYGFKDLPTGVYSVTASLSGFVTATRESVRVLDGQTGDSVDFALCLRPLEFIDWVVPRSLEEMWSRSDVVARVRIADTAPVRSDCPSRDVLHAATVLEVFKSKPTSPLGQSVSFVQKNWVYERVPYRTGQEMVAFLVTTPSGFARACGPYCLFLISGERVTSFPSPVNTADVTTTEFLTRLRELGKARDGA